MASLNLDLKVDALPPLYSPMVALRLIDCSKATKQAAAWGALGFLPDDSQPFDGQNVRPPS